jgi:GNAT superfamily N-acetyltransferase
VSHLKNIQIRKATVDDVDRIVRLSNAGGPSGSRSVLPEKLPQAYYDAFAKIDSSPDNELMVAELDHVVVGTFQLTYLTYLAAAGQEDAQVESVHVAEEYRSRGIGAFMMNWVIEQARERNCRRVQLTTNKLRKDAHRFYKRLGFKDSHEGMKLDIG